MKKITYYKLTYALGIFLIILGNILIYSLYLYLEPKDVPLGKLLFIVSIGSLVVIFSFILEIIKTSQIVKSEKIQSFKYRVKFHEKEIERYNELIEQTDKDY